MRIAKYLALAAAILVCLPGCEENNPPPPVAQARKPMPPPPPPPRRNTTTQTLPTGWTYIHSSDLNPGPLTSGQARPVVVQQAPAPTAPPAAN